MNQNNYLIHKSDGSTTNLIELATEHLNFTLGNSELFLDPINFSTIQYCNPDALSNINVTSISIYNAIAKMSRNLKFLNFGTGGGFLEFYVDQFKAIDLTSVEWEQQLENFKVVRKFLEIEPDYICNSILSDDFEIYNCDEKYDFIICVRFFPLNKSHSQDVDSVKKILSKFKKYSDRVIIIDDVVTNYTIPVKRYFNSITNEKIKIVGLKNIEYQVLDLE